MLLDAWLQVHAVRVLLKKEHFSVLVGRAEPQSQLVNSNNRFCLQLLLFETVKVEPSELSEPNQLDGSGLGKEKMKFEFEQINRIVY